MRVMRERHVMVESPLTSNEQILQVSGPEHPFPTYRTFDVPITLATDDEGISRTDLTREYTRATTDYRLSYRDFENPRPHLPGPRLPRRQSQSRPPVEPRGRLRRLRTPVQLNAITRPPRHIGSGWQ